MFNIYVVVDNIFVCYKSTEILGVEGYILGVRGYVDC